MLAWDRRDHAEYFPATQPLRQYRERLAVLVGGIIPAEAAVAGRRLTSANALVPVRVINVDLADLAFLPLMFDPHARHRSGTPLSW